MLHGMLQMIIGQRTPGNQFLTTGVSLNLPDSGHYHPVDDNIPTRRDWVSLWTAVQIGFSAHFVLPYRLILFGVVISIYGWLLLGVEERVEELQENSAVAETSLLVSRTLGMEDSPSSAKEPLVDDGVESQPKKTFASLFVTTGSLIEVTR
ncbi:hypothetical protein M9H77_17717 [Catharanthus roseus]|uniref:Uncharacterized protein n=1 Tax=Catharanthus roseus TaxID=4058 RepID=A0ACC0B5E7_CATRO|nr:hypothetical protein M9H77_17717 [Catharanthus roseus]